LQEQLHEGQSAQTTRDGQGSVPGDVLEVDVRAFLIVREGEGIKKIDIR
jgi:hypothetical protein